MSDTIIRVENLGKKYILGHQKQQEKYTALRDVIANGVKGLAHHFNQKSKIQNRKLEEFWALKDVSFEVKRGDRIGIIGRNGAGKSTLLKILSRITEPTTGRIQIKGRVASLLEVGTGFHPELTGRENIFLNGAILGMSKQEIRRKFDEIVAFAEVEKFLDTPVKRYSSGMYVRLAFAVAAHLQTDILLVDEVLAVGDAEFQKKCLGKMQNVSLEGRTVLFVSHDLSNISRLCQKGLVLETGNSTIFNDVNAAIQHYKTGSKIEKIQESSRKSGIYLHQAWLSESKLDLSTSKILKLSLVINSNRDINLSLDWRVYDQLHHPVGYGSSKILQDQWIELVMGSNLLELTIHLPSLAVGVYSLEFDLCIPWVEAFFRSSQSLEFDVTRCNPFKGSMDLQQQWKYGVIPLYGVIEKQ